MRGLVLALALAASIFGHSPATFAASADPEFDQVMRLLATRRHGEVSFIEQRFIKLLKRPAESSGELIYDAPDRLEKRTVEPRPETLMLNGEQITVQRPHATRVLDLKSYPQLVPFIESIRATLAGDRAALERHFKVDFTGTVARWTMSLTPLETAAAKAVSAVQIDGGGDLLYKVEIRQADGDRSLMTLRAHPQR